MNTFAMILLGIAIVVVADVCIFDHLTREQGRDDVRREACKRGLAIYVADPVSGKTEFQWREVKP